MQQVVQHLQMLTQQLLQLIYNMEPPLVRMVVQHRSYTEDGRTFPNDVSIHSKSQVTNFDAEVRALVGVTDAGGDGSQHMTVVLVLSLHRTRA